MKILSLNVNGLRAFYNRGGEEGGLLQHLLDTYNPDILLFQEIKCSMQDFKYWLQEWEQEYHLVAFPNVNMKGYAGVGAMIKKSVTEFEITSTSFLDSDYDSGRVININFPEQNTRVIGVYVINSYEKDELRAQWDVEFRNYLALQRQKTQNVLVLGDLNVCRAPEDCWAFESYYDQLPGVKEYEMSNFKDLLEDFKDCWRDFHEGIEEYSWFSYRGESRYKNQGFRLDYALVNKEATCSVEMCEYIGGACEYSDHKPVLLEIKL